MSLYPPRGLLALVLPLTLLGACAGRNSIQVVKPNPPVADLAVEAKPVMPDAAISDDAAAAKYSSDIEGWGDRGWATVGRICRWAEANGMPHPLCPPAN
jgi:hypothetical protein